MSEPLAVREAPASYQVELETQRVRPGYKQTEVGVIPEDWIATKLTSIADVRDGTHDSPRYIKTGVPFVTSKNILAGKIDFQDITFISDDDANDVNKRSKVDLNDILMSMIGTVGNAALVDFEPDFCIKNVALVKPIISKVAPQYLIQLFRSAQYGRYIENKLDGGIQKFISLGMLRGLDVGLPPTKTEQEAIAEALNDADALIEALQQLIAKKRLIKQGAMQELLSGKKRLPGFGGEWEVKPLGDLFNFSGGFSASRDQLSNNGHCYLHYGDIHKSSKTYIDVRAEYQDIPKLDMPLKCISSGSLLDDGDVVFVDASEDDEGTSKHVVIVNKDKMPYISGLHTIVAKSKADDMDNLYKRYCFQTTVVKRQFYFFAVGTKVSGISKTNIAKVTLAVPPLPEQTAIATILSDMDTEITALETRLSKTRELKQGMMHKLLTGRIRLT